MASNSSYPLESPPPYPSESPPPYVPRHMCVFFYSSNKIRLLNASRVVVNLIHQTILSHWPEIQYACDKYGAMTFKLSGYPFCEERDSAKAVLCMKLASKILEDLYTDGWTLISSSELTRTHNQTAWFFKHTSPENPNVRVVCLSTRRNDTLQLTNAPPELVFLFDQTLRTNYSLGIQDCKVYDHGVEYKLGSNPWYGDGEATVAGRLIILQIMEAFAANGYRFYGTGNLKETTDSLFFIQDISQQSPIPLWMLTLDRNDRMRLLKSPRDVLELVRMTITQAWHQGLEDERIYYGAHEFILGGKPWIAREIEKVNARLLITRLLSILHGHGWQVHGVLDISRVLTIKSVIVFRPCKPECMEYICLSLSDIDKMKILNADQQTVNKIRSIIQRYWSQGIQKESMDSGSPEFKLRGRPWDGHPEDEIHARSLMCHILEELCWDKWNVIAAADVSSMYYEDSDNSDRSYAFDVDSWFMARPSIG